MPSIFPAAIRNFTPVFWLRLITFSGVYGTRLNGHAIDGSAVLQAGDVISIGSPPREFRVAIEVSADGS